MGGSFRIHRGNLLCLAYVCSDVAGASTCCWVMRSLSTSGVATAWLRGHLILTQLHPEFLSPRSKLGKPFYFLEKAGIEAEAGFLAVGSSVALLLGASRWGSLLVSGGETSWDLLGQCQSDTGCWSFACSPGTGPGAGQGPHCPASGFRQDLASRARWWLQDKRDQ